jgi:hypothetical protein
VILTLNMIDRSQSFEREKLRIRSSMLDLRKTPVKTYGRRRASVGPSSRWNRAELEDFRSVVASESPTNKNGQLAEDLSSPEPMTIQGGLDGSLEGPPNRGRRVRRSNDQSSNDEDERIKPKSAHNSLKNARTKRPTNADSDSHDFSKQSSRHTRAVQDRKGCINTQGDVSKRTRSRSRAPLMIALEKIANETLAANDRERSLDDFPKHSRARRRIAESKSVASPRRVPAVHEREGRVNTRGDASMRTRSLTRALLMNAVGTLPASEGESAISSRRGKRNRADQGRKERNEDRRRLNSGFAPDEGSIGVRDHPGVWAEDPPRKKADEGSKKGDEARRRLNNGFAPDEGASGASYPGIWDEDPRRKKADEDRSYGSSIQDFPTNNKRKPSTEPFQVSPASSPPEVKEDHPAKRGTDAVGFDRRGQEHEREDEPEVVKPTSKKIKQSVKGKVSAKHIKIPSAVGAKKTLSRLETDAWRLLDSTISNVKVKKAHNVVEHLKAMAVKRVVHSLESKEVEDEQTKEPVESFPEIEPMAATRVGSLPVKKTYGTSRSYVSEPVGDMMMDLVVEGNNDSSTSEDEHMIADLNNINELRAKGANAKFIDGVQYIIDGLWENKTARIASLLELANNMKDAEFIRSFKSTNFPIVLIRELKDDQDEFVNFLFCVILRLLLEESSGVAASVFRSSSIMNLLVSMISDTEDIVVKSRQKGSGMSKMVQQELEKLVHQLKIPGNAASRSFIALTALTSLQRLDSHISAMLYRSLVGHVRDILGVAQELFQSVKTDNVLLCLVLNQLEFLVEGGASVRVMEQIDGVHPIVEAINMVKRYVQGGNVGLLEVPTAMTLRLLISLTTNCSVVDPAMSNVYDSALALALVEFLQRRSEHNVVAKKPPKKRKERTTEQRASQNQQIYLYSAGFLVNLCESPAVRNSLVGASAFDELKTTVFSTAFDSDDQTVLHLQGCQYLALGIVAAHDKDSFQEEEIEHIKHGLTMFKDNLPSEWGSGLHQQILVVLRLLEENE